MLKSALDECYDASKQYLMVIHGYRHGQILQKYVRSPQFLEDMKIYGFEIKCLKIEHPGVTRFQLESWHLPETLRVKKKKKKKIKASNAESQP
jgi:hypothetical protein